MEEINIALLLFNGLALLIACYVIYFKSYFAKKGENLAAKEDGKAIAFLTEQAKNLATKADIQEITRLTEGVKRDIDVLKESQISFQGLKRAAIINFYEKYFQILHYIMGLSFEHVRPDDVRKKVDMLQYEFNNAEANLRLFVEEYPQLEKIIEIGRAHV